MSDLAALAARLQVLEDVGAIERLKAAYCAGCDDDHNPETVAALFVPDGVWSAVGFYDRRGHDEIKRHFQAVRDSGRMRTSAHMVSNPSIVVDGDRATGAWRYLMMYTNARRPDAIRYFRIIGRYEDDFVRVDGEWRFAHLRTWAFEHNAYVSEDSKIRPPAEHNHRH
ncbi:MAG: nuclear transport factor 2 family protein [Ilumatobacteraceae bacterium]